MASIKFCGMTNLDDCLAAVDLGVDFVGFVFYRKSRRYVDPARAAAITGRLAGRIATVGVFVDDVEETVDRIMDECRLDFAQVYRPAPGRKRICAYRVSATMPEIAPGEGLILLDSYSEGFGGSGKAFDPGLLEGCPYLGRAFVAGGLDEDNVARVLRFSPFGVDLVTSVEKEKGRKDRRKMARFVRTVRNFSS